jgi:hypothetical protein
MLINSSYVRMRDWQGQYVSPSVINLLDLAGSDGVSPRDLMLLQFLGKYIHLQCHFLDKIISIIVILLIRTISIEGKVCHFSSFKELLKKVGKADVPEVKGRLVCQSYAVFLRYFAEYSRIISHELS